nr:MAG TPA: hypothetical protein [Caudoviricetes sp.]
MRSLISLILYAIVLFRLLILVRSTEHRLSLSD